MPGADSGDAPGADGRPEAPAAREPKTETTLTTRVRINIPGSRPIPPVVLRTPVADGGNAAEPGAGEPQQAAERPQGGGLPRRTPGAGIPAAQQQQQPPAGPGEGKPAASDWFAPRKNPTPPAGTPRATPPGAPQGGGPQQGGAPFPPAGDGGGPGFGAGPATPAAGTPAYGSGAQPPPNIPYFTENPPAPPFPGPAAGPGEGAPYPAADPYDGAFGGGPFATDTPAAGTPGAGRPGEPFGGEGPAAGDPFGTGQETVPFPGFHHPDPELRPGPPDGPTTGPVTGAMRDPGAGFPPPPAGPRGGDPSDTLAEGFPAVTPGAPGRPRPPAPGPGAPAAGPAVPPPGPSVTPAAPAGSGDGGGKKKAKRKGRSKIVLLVGLVVVAAAVTYGAGLVMDHSDVPNGTIVLGVDIGGDTRQQAVKALDTALGDRSTAPLTVSVGGHTSKIKPELAGLVIDTEGTVDSVAHRTYDPVAVVRSLFGGTRDVPPHVPVDGQKLRSQLAGLSAPGSVKDGMVKFANGKPVIVPGTSYQAVDQDAAVTRITAAYEKRARTGRDEPVALPVTEHQPLVTRAALDQAVKTIGDPAMSGTITVSVAGRSLPFSPQHSLSEILTIVPVPGTGKLTLHIDLQKLKGLYGTAFDGVLLERGNGSSTPVTPQDVASAMLPQLGRTAPMKTAVISNVAQ